MKAEQFLDELHKLVAQNHNVFHRKYDLSLTAGDDTSIMFSVNSSPDGDDSAHFFLTVRELRTDDDRPAVLSRSFLNGRTFYPESRQICPGCSSKNIGREQVEDPLIGFQVFECWCDDCVLEWVEQSFLNK